MRLTWVLAVLVCLAAWRAVPTGAQTSNDTAGPVSPAPPIANKKLVVVVVVRKPFAIYTSGKSGNAAFSGFIVDLFREVRCPTTPLSPSTGSISLCAGCNKDSGVCMPLFEVMMNLGTNYTFVKFEGQGTSEALSLLTHKPVEVDMVLGDIMITKERLELVDFTVPFISMPLNVVTRTREAQKDTFGFLKPFAFEVQPKTLITRHETLCNCELPCVTRVAGLDSHCGHVFVLWIVHIRC